MFIIKNMRFVRLPIFIVQNSFPTEYGNMKYSGQIYENSTAKKSGKVSECYNRPHGYSSDRTILQKWTNCRYLYASLNYSQKLYSLSSVCPAMWYVI